MKIHITSPAKTIDKPLVEYAASFLKAQGFEVTLAEHVCGQFNYFSGTDEERLADFQRAINDKSVNVILCARGGYGSVRIIDRLDFSALRSYPKLIAGFSDITVFHNHIHRYLNLPTLHATVPLNFQENSAEALESLLNVLNNRENHYHFEPSHYNRSGKVEAVVVGGNLSILYSLLGTDSDIDMDGKILFIEDIGEQLYALDRIMFSLQKSGKLARLAGLMVGGMSNIKDTEIPFGLTYEQIIAERVAAYSYPVCFNFPAGHIADNRAILLGTPAVLEVSESQSMFRQKNEFQWVLT